MKNKPWASLQGSLLGYTELHGIPRRLTVRKAVKDACEEPLALLTKELGVVVCQKLSYFFQIKW